MIEEVKEFAEDIKDAVGDKGFILIIIAVVGIFIYNLSKSTPQEETAVQTATAYASYPDVDTNADVVIDTLQNSLLGATNEIIGAMDSYYQEEKVYTEEQFQATNDYIKEGIEATKDLSEKVDNIDTKPVVIERPVQNTPTNNSGLSNYIQQLESSGTGQIMTSNGLTVSQNASMLGTMYNGSKVTSVSTTGSGDTIIKTADGKSHTIAGTKNHVTGETK